MTDVRTHYPELWENNPFLTPLDESDPNVETIDCHYPLINRARTGPGHFLEGYARYISDHLKVPIHFSKFGGDIHLSRKEREFPQGLKLMASVKPRYWIIVAGGKYDFTVKWWEPSRYQAVVDHFDGDIQFVQVGNSGDFHPLLRGVVDLRGKTSLRELAQLTYHADGVLCPVTMMMHLCAAVPTLPDRVRARACVVVAGGREQPSWAAYPTHQYLHVVGALDCCAQTGCWRGRTTPLGDGRNMDEEDQLCLDVVDGWPRCMKSISVERVIEAVRLQTQTFESQ